MHLNENVHPEQTKNQLEQSAGDPSNSYSVHNDSENLNQQTFSNELNQTSVISPDKNDDDFGDFTDFADFADFNSSEIDDENNQNKKNQDWMADFNNVLIPSEQTLHISLNANDFDEFSDFQTAAPSFTSASKNIPETRPSLDSSKFIFNDHELHEMFCSTFISKNLINNNESISNEHFKDILEHSDSKIFMNKLQNMDLKRIYSYNKWKDMATFNVMLQALKLDKLLIRQDPVDQYQNPFSFDTILVPEPIKQNESQSLRVSSINLSKQTPIEPIISSNTNEIIPTDSVMNEIAPNFVNQDLDFFESKYNVKSPTQDDSKTIPLDDFDAIFDQQNKLQTSSNQTLNSMPVLSNIGKLLSTIKNLETTEQNAVDESSLQNSQQITNSTQILSVEALQILNDLPNLSFMRSKGLLFPFPNDTTRK